MHAIHCEGVGKTYPHFMLNNVDLVLPQGTVMGFVGPNGAGKSTTLRIIMGLVHQDTGRVSVLGNQMPEAQVTAKWNIGFVSEDMRLYSHRTIGFHLDFLRRVFPNWDNDYARELLTRFDLNPDQKVKGLSHGQRVKAALLTVFARKPQLLVFDEPTTGLDPVARKVILEEMMRVMESENRSILFSSHNTLDVEQISDHITFINQGRIVASDDKETFLDSWRRLRLVVADDYQLPELPEAIEVQQMGHQIVLTVSGYDDSLEARLKNSGAAINDIQRLTLEEIFIASVEAGRNTPTPVKASPRHDATDNQGAAA